MTKIVVARRDGIAREPDGTQHRVYRGKTLADAEHPVVLSSPNEWMPMEVQLALPTTGEYDGPLGAPVSHEQVAQFENDVAELTETLEQRDAELQRLANGLAERGVELPAEDDREPGWLVDLALAYIEVAAGESMPAVVEPEVAPVPPPRGARRAATRGSDRPLG